MKRPRDAFDLAKFVGKFCLVIEPIMKTSYGQIASHFTASFVTFDANTAARDRDGWINPRSTLHTYLCKLPVCECTIILHILSFISILFNHRCLSRLPCPHLPIARTQNGYRDTYLSELFWKASNAIPAAF